MSSKEKPPSCVGTFPRQYRKIQVLSSPKKSVVEKNQLFLPLGMGITTGMAPPRAVIQGWLDLLAIKAESLLSQSRGTLAPITRGTDYLGESEAAVALAHAECHIIDRSTR